MKHFLLRPLFLTALIAQTFALSTSAAGPAAKPLEHFPKIVDETALKESVNPCDDFYQFACGTWIDNTTIPGDKKAVYRQSTPMADAVDIRLNQILVAYANGDYQIPATYATKLAAAYTSCMTADKHSGEAMQTLQSRLQQIQNLRSATDFARLIAIFHLEGVNLFNFYSMQDYNDSTTVLADVSQAGMVMGNPAYYLEQDAKSVEIREKYKEYISQIFVLMGSQPNQANAMAENILAIETKLASKAYSVVDQSDPDKVNHVMDFASLQKLTPSFDWQTYLKTVGLNTNKFNVDEPEFFQNMDLVLKGLSVSDRATYLSWLVLNRSAQELGGNFEKAHFAFWGTVMTGTQQMLPRWKMCTQAVEENLGYALAEAYVKTFDGAAIAKKTNSMIDDVKDVFIADLNMLTTGANAWIDGATVQEAIAKARKIERKVGAPEKFRDYSALNLSATNFLENSIAITVFETRRDLNKVGKPVDKSEWGMMPWEVNAYYDRSNNEFVFPFGILQPPSLDLEASDGANYGAFGGGTIGHELIHGFDSAGSKYDQNGNLKEWWSAETQAKFDERAQCYSRQASEYTIQQVGMKVNGEQTLEENIADQGGVKLGYMALDRILKTRPERKPWLGRYNERQQYWIAYAQSWCSKPTEAALRNQMTNDVHPPSEFRVNGVMMNRPEFAADFKCEAGQKMAPTNRCSMW